MTTATSAKPKSRFLRFSLRTLLVVMLVVCVTLGWKVEKTRKQRETVAWVQQSGGRVIYDNDDLDSQPPGPKWLRKQLGRDFFDEVVHVRFYNIQVSDVTPLAGLSNLVKLDLASPWETKFPSFHQ
jgi:hypothetical protein